jgi:SAM-dependent methyltransferase
MKLNLGAGDTVLDGYEPRDGARGDCLFPLPDADGSLDEIRASHVLEHFASAEVPKVLADWVRALKPGGVLKIAVPDFERIAAGYLQGEQINVQGYVMGGQTDARDFHKTLFDQDELEQQLRAAGLFGIQRWVSEIGDCARLPISLNLQGVKPPAKLPRVAAAMSVPRLGFMDNFFCAMKALPRLGISLHKHTGAFWGQCITRCMEEILEDPAPDYILTIDYDSVFTSEHVEQLVALAAAHPEADAIAALQASRHGSEPLMTKRGEDGKPGGAGLARPSRRTSRDRHRALRPDAHPCRGAEDAAAAVVQGRARRRRPLGRRQGRRRRLLLEAWERQGKTLMLANHVAIGHAELMIRWPDRNLQATYQISSEFWKSGAPANVWR